MYIMEKKETQSTKRLVVKQPQVKSVNVAIELKLQ